MNINQTPLNPQELAELQELSNEARGHILTMTTLSASGHPGGSMSTIDFLMTLYRLIDVDPKNINKSQRDRVVMSHGHVSPAAYSIGRYRIFSHRRASQPISLGREHFRRSCRTRCTRNRVG